MKKIYLAILFLVFTSFNSAENNGAKKNSFAAGEWFKFRIHYGFLNASYATLNLKETTLNGNEVYHVKGYGETTGMARWFFKVEDNYESYFDKKTIKPYKFIRKIDEGGYTKDIEIDFDHDNNKAVVKDHKHNKTHVLKTPDNIQDLLSAFYYLRNNYDVKSIKKGDEITLDLLFEEDETFKFKLKFLGRETTRTKFGKVRCLKFRPYVQSGRVFKEEESLTLWVSDDDNKVPIRIKADLAIGSLKADLEAFKGLKHQFKIEVDQ
ncbi:DUF3108 domain-containing protein [Abyssalbus ytuae]|uniref:DUF3108 domain-containing protein n=1 Tax=Abyssalbus ytuae TaxID=2926907 RepID=A0A9E7CUY4_9FLAO|nr:DUF3108 domain-containing protein [Abyssalbus ytuae]UOB19137.1 DUF3108 domain-containing protein [Abyssalbus ytuae]